MNLSKEEMRIIRKNRYDEKINNGIKKNVINECSHNGYKLEQFTEYQNDKEVVLASVKSDGNSLRFASELMKSDYDIVLAAVKSKGESLRYASEQLKSNLEIIKHACINNINTISYLNDSYKCDKEFLKNTIQTIKYSECKFFKDLPINIRGDKDIISICALLSYEILEFVPDEIRTILTSDKKFMLPIIKNNSAAYIFISEDLKADDELINITVSNDGRMLRHAINYTLDIKIILSAIRYNSEAFKFVPKILSLDKTFIKEASIINYYIAEYFDDVIKNDNKFMFELININGKIIDFLPFYYLYDIDIVKSAISTNGLLLERLSENFQSDEEIVTIAVKNEGISLNSASNILKENENICIIAVTQNPNALEYCINPSKIVIHTAIKQNGLILKYAPLLYRSDFMTIMYALSATGFIFLNRYIDGEFKNRTNIIDTLEKYMVTLSANIRNFHYFMFSGLPIELNICIGEYYDIKSLKDTMSYCLKALINLS